MRNDADAKYLIVCVDDDRDFLQSVGRLAERGIKQHPLADRCELELACGPDEFRELLAEMADEPFVLAVLVTDQIMPGCTGIELIEQIKPDHPDTSCVLLTGYAGMESARYAINNRLLDRYTSKPIDDVDAFTETIASELDRFHLRRTRALQAEEIEHQSEELREANRRLDTMRRTAESVAYFFRELHTLDLGDILDHTTDWLPQLFGARSCFLSVPDPRDPSAPARERHRVCAAAEANIADTNRVLSDALAGGSFRASECRGPCSGAVDSGHDEDGCVVIPVPLVDGAEAVASLCVCGIADKESLQDDAVSYKTNLVTDVVGANIRNAAAHAQTVRLATEDGLTGLKNRRAFEEALRSEWGRYKRHDCEFCLAMIDIDRFKDINDTHGHATGDDVLKAVADALASGSRDCDMVARLGGDEFIVLLTETDLNGALTAISRVIAELGDVDVSASDISPTVSVGIASARGKDSPAALLRAADAALYKSKETGRARVSTE